MELLRHDAVLGDRLQVQCLLDYDLKDLLLSATTTGMPLAIQDCIQDRLGLATDELTRYRSDTTHIQDR